MTIRLRYYLAILPLFLGVALINGLLVYALDRQEIRWGLQQRAEGAAAVLAGFWPTIVEEAPARQRARLRAFSRRLGGVAITGFGADGTPQVLVEREGIPAPTLDAGRAGGLADNGLGWHWQSRPEAPSDLNIGYASVPETTEDGLSVMAVSEPDRTLREATAELVEQLLLLSAVLLLAGVLVAEWLTRYARRELGALARGAHSLAEGQYLQHWPSGRIRELNDLGGTLLTMASLLADGTSQTRRRFFEAELLPGDADLAAALRESVLPYQVPDELAARCAWRCLGPQLAEEFLGQRRVETGWWLVAGTQRTDPAARSELQRSLAALATRDYLLDRVAGGIDGDEMSRALSLFPCSVLQVLWLPDAGEARGWILDPLKPGLVPFTPRRRFAMIGTVPREAMRLARTYEGQFPKRPLAQAMDEISGLLSGSFRGLLVIAESQPVSLEVEPA
ncbi:hypothetical protein [Pseudomarimonas salicorniae]|uniref:HAMP domain-containing protein n=1 Tax=Pseudomarimonas salicorniae TaxID=2933270 RepID=A0ABT0GML1_9GAMM|nr:hypothetical protein [Lysobacter sp. CAU 1642]MCK7595607.1 hypothetical protein [Lysobacter sp. CAU 1642]